MNRNHEHVEASANRDATVRDRFDHPRRIWPRALLLGGVALVVYLLIAGGFRFQYRQTSFAHHVWTADAFLHGQLHVRGAVIETAMQRERGIAASFLESRLRQQGGTMRDEDKRAWIEQRARLRVEHDWTIQDGRLYGYWAPLTAVLTVPWVAAFGPTASDLLISAVYGAINVGLFYVLLRRVDRVGLCAMSERCCIAMTLLLAFGTVHFFLAAGGRVWFACQIVTLMMLLVAAILTCGRTLHPWHALAAGVFFGAAILARNFAGLTGLFFIVMFWLRLDGAFSQRIASWSARVALFLIPTVAAICTQAAYNDARFDDVRDSGQRGQIATGGEEQFRGDYETYGQFHAHFLADNAYYYLLNWKLVRNDDGRWRPDWYGNSMFLVTPPLLYLFLIWRKPLRLIAALLAGAVPLLLALLLFRATGFRQFGNRYLLDIMPFLLLLVAIGMRGRVTFPAFSLIVLAVAANLFGTYWMCTASFRALEPWIGRAIPWLSIGVAIIGVLIGAAVYLSRDVVTTAQQK